MMDEDPRIEIPCNDYEPIIILTMCGLENRLRSKEFCVVDP